MFDNNSSESCVMNGAADGDRDHSSGVYSRVAVLGTVGLTRYERVVTGRRGDEWEKIRPRVWRRVPRDLTPSRQLHNIKC
ncbi:hypothetical protein V1281_007420 [Nitrobacteraceae bacterium AZCC 2161]|jgi:hypothetical protein